MMNGLTTWAGMILDRLTLDAPEEYEDELAETAMEVVLPSLAIRWRAMLNDNDNRPIPCDPG
ncbi:hypothetical protein [Sphingobium sp. CFD-1]|uniref:hypothetical protein n=1 Tax=Sphingobium sp. CFD-1 TaxID=2878545 RepID=UPI00214AF194|nr:hypothetical protein [Sphingobium sp. CFD-1]